MRRAHIPPVPLKVNHMEAIKPVSTMRTPSGGSNPASTSRRKPPLVLRLLSLLCFAAGFVIVATPLVLRAMS